MDSRYAKIKSKGSIIKVSVLVCMGLILLLSEMAFGAQATASLLKHSSIDQRLVVSVNFENEPLANVLHKLARKVDVGISYKTETVPDKMVTYQARNVSVYSVLDAVLKDTGLYATLSKNRKVILIKQRYLQKVAKLQSTISGTVTDAGTGETLPGVNIQVKGTTTGTSTDSKGHYELSVESLQDTLVFSFVGYQLQQVPIKGQTTINIALKSQVISGQELVVTALGVQQEAKSLTYSTQTVDTKSLTEAPQPNIMKSLEGKVAGLSINESGTGVGSDTRVVLRGNRSISGNSQPLYVIDGVPIQGAFNEISPDNIASINVLKGPNAAALYGSQAQNGVIIIETRKGEKGSVNISLNSNFIMGRPINYLDVQNEYGQGVSGIYQKTSEESWGPRMEGQMVEQWSPDPSIAGTQYAFTSQPDNFKKMFQTSMNLSNNIYASIGTDAARTVFSYTRTDARGIMPNNNLGRHNLSIRINNQLKDWLSLDAKLSYLKQKINNPINSGGSQYFNPYRNLYNMPRNIRYQDYKNYDYVDNEGNLRQNYWDPGSTTGRNPFWEMYRNLNQGNRERVVALTSLTADLTDNLSFMVRASLDRLNNTTEEKLYNDTYGSYQYGGYNVNKNDNSEWNADFLLSYNKDFTKDWDINANFGGSLKKAQGEGSLSAATGDQLVVPNFFTLSNTQFPSASFSPAADVETQSLYAFTKIGWKDALYLNVTARNDWSSTLPADNRSYFYPSVGLSAVLSDLIPAFPKLFSFAKIRASWARVGSSAPAYMLNRTATFAPGGNNGFLTLNSVLPNDNLKPEKTESFEVGLDLRFLEGRLGLKATAYKENTTNQLFTIALPAGSGAASYFTNGGDVENKGLEAIVSVKPIQTKNFNWNIDVNFATNRNWINKISDERPRVVVGSDSYFREYVVEQGKEFGNVYSRGWQRDDQGRVIVDSNGLPLITTGRTVKVANFNPDWTGSISSTFSYKNISFSFLINHRQGGTVASSTNAILYGEGVAKETAKGRDGGLIFGKNLFPNETAVLQDGSPNNIEINSQDFWRSEGGRNTPVGEAFVQDATNMRLKEVTLGYSLPSSILTKVSSISNIKISLVARNLFFIYRKGNWDPDILTGTDAASEGYQAFAPPTMRTFGANLKIDF